MKSKKPLQRYRVIELSTYVAAPSCARLLADWGADVIKIESVTGDVWRFYGETVSTPVSEDENPIWDIANANKRGIAVDLKTSDGKKILYQLLEKADVFLTNTRAAALKKLGLDYESLKERYPQLIYAHLTGFGEKGPDVNAPGFDSVAYFGRSGFMADLVSPGQYPVLSPVSFGDMTVGSTLFGGICAALLGRQVTGKGDKISISLYGSAIWFAGALVASTQECYGNHYPRTRYEGNPMAIPYLCSDGEWIMITIIDYDRYWPLLCKALEREDLIKDERFTTRLNMLNNRSEMIRILEKEFVTRDSAEWIKRLTKADIVHDRLKHFKEVTRDKQAWANNYLMDYTFENGRKAALPSPPIQSLQMGTPLYRKGPLLGEHTLEILAEIGYSDSEIAQMKNTKVVIAR